MRVEILYVILPDCNKRKIEKKKDKKKVLIKRKTKETSWLHIFLTDASFRVFYTQSCPTSTEALLRT